MLRRATFCTSDAIGKNAFSNQRWDDRMPAPMPHLGGANQVANQIWRPRAPGPIGLIAIMMAIATAVAADFVHHDC